MYHPLPVDQDTSTRILRWKTHRLAVPQAVRIQTIWKLLDQVFLESDQYKINSLYRIIREYLRGLRSRSYQTDYERKLRQRIADQLKHGSTSQEVIAYYMHVETETQQIEAQMPSFCLIKPEDF